VVSSTPRPHFTPGKDPVPIVQEARWAPGPAWTGGISRPHRDSIPGHPVRSQSLYRLSYRAHKHTHTHTHTHVTYTGRRFIRATEFCKVAPNIFSIKTVVAFLLHTKIFNNSSTLSRERQIAWRFTGRRIVGSQDGSCFSSPLWRLEFGSGSQPSGKSVNA